MPRKRLRPFLEEVLGDADLRASAERVAEPGPAAPAPFPPPPWERAPEPDTASANGQPAIGQPAGGSPAVAPPPTADIVEHPFAAPLAGGAPPPSDPNLSALAEAFPLDPPLGAGSMVAPVDAPPLTPDVAASAAPAAAVVEPPVIGAPPRPDRAFAAPPSVPSPPGILTGTPDSAGPGRRRRRSASLLPPLPSPADMPDDALGRVLITSLPLPPGSVAAPVAAPSSSAEPAPITAVGGDAPLAGWLPVLGLGVALVLVFIVGVLVTR